MPMGGKLGTSISGRSPVVTISKFLVGSVPGKTDLKAATPKSITNLGREAFDYSKSDGLRMPITSSSSQEI